MALELFIFVISRQTDASDYFNARSRACDGDCTPRKTITITPTYTATLYTKRMPRAFNSGFTFLSAYTASLQERSAAEMSTRRFIDWSRSFLLATSKAQLFSLQYYGRMMGGLRTDFSTEFRLFYRGFRRAGYFACAGDSQIDFLEDSATAAQRASFSNRQIYYALRRLLI